MILLMSRRGPRQYARLYRSWRCDAPDDRLIRRELRLPRWLDEHAQRIAADLGCSVSQLGAAAIEQLVREVDAGDAELAIEPIRVKIHKSAKKNTHPGKAPAEPP
jgi:hypothetical protein